MRRVKMQQVLADRSGFVYLNVLLDLILLAALMPLIILFYMYASTYSEDLESGNLEWQLFSSELQTYLAGAESIELINEGQGFRVTQLGEEYDIEKYGNYIRKQKAQKGHEIMLTEIRSCIFQLEGDILKITVLLLNGSEERSEYAITGPEI